jgi:hypothetical protein
LSVSFKAPFKVVGKQHLADISNEVENERKEGAYYSSFTVNGPVPAGSSVDWIFDRKPNG